MDLSIDDGVGMVLRENLDVLIEKVTPEIKATALEGEDSAFDGSLFSSFKYTDSTTPQSSRAAVAAGGRSSVESESFDMELGLSKKTYSGTEYTIEFNDMATSNTFNNFDYEYDSFAGVTMTKPLMNGAGRDVNLYSYKTASMDRDISVLRLQDMVIGTVARFELSYWDLVQATEELALKEESLRLAEVLFDESAKKLDAEVISRLELTQAEAGVASRKEAVVTARESVNKRESKLKRFITNDVFAMRRVRINPADDPALSEVPGLEEAIGNALLLRPDLRAAKLDVAKDDIKIKYRENGLHPEVDLEASYGYNGLGSSLDDSVSSMDSNPKWTVGVVLSYPLGNRGAKSDLKAATLEAKQAVLKVKVIEQDIITALGDAIDGMEASKQRFEAARVSTRLQEDSLEAEETKLEAGLSTALDVLELQEELEEARTSELSALIDFERERTRFLRAEGSLLLERGYSFGGKVAGGGNVADGVTEYGP